MTENTQASDGELGARLARKVLLFMGETTEDAVMTIVEDGSTAQELRGLAKAYIEAPKAFTVCPACSGTDIVSTNEFEKEYSEKGQFIRQKTECENCGREWWGVFSFSHIEASV